MSHRNNVFHHFAAGRAQNDSFSLESPLDLSHNAISSPKADLRETTNMYYLEAEFSGISGPNDIKIHWLNGSTLQIQATIHKTNLEAVWCNDNPDNKPQNQVTDAVDLENKCGEPYSLGEDVLAQKRGQHNSHVASTMAFWLNERRTGVYMRNFCFAVAVDTNGVQAKLSQGLLMIMVPKRETAAVGRKKIYIEAS
jgi:HSP20 family molecular chaperone IbpA